jgi:hypothetical protein
MRELRALLRETRQLRERRQSRLARFPEDYTNRKGTRRISPSVVIVNEFLGPKKV